MKNKLITVVFLFLFIVVYAQEDNSDIIVGDIKIKEIIAMTYKADTEGGVLVKGNLIRKEIIIFNKEGKLVSKTSYNIDGEVLGKLEVIYNEEGLMVANKIYNENNELEAQSTYRYDKYKNNIEKNYSYNKYDITYGKRVLIYNFVDTKRKKQQQIEDRKMNKAYSFEYDGKKNWIKKTLMIKGENKEVTERTIIYGN